MSKKLFFLISFVLVAGLNSAVHAQTTIEVNNPSFEYDINGVQITEEKGWDVVKGWNLRDTTGDEYGLWWLVKNEWDSEAYEAADGNVCSFSVTGGDPNDANDNCDIYQILDPNLDANSTIAANRRYTLTFNALNCGDPTKIPSVYGALFYSLGGVNAPPVNDVTLAIEGTTLTSPKWGEPGYAGWEEITLNYTALPGAGSIGERLGVKLGTPYPWYNGAWIAMDNVRVDWLWATDAWDPNPADGGELVSKVPILGWTPGVWADQHEVYFGTDETEVANADNTDTTGIYKSTQDPCSYTPSGPLELGKTYYWKITEVNSGYSGPAAPPPWEGDVWSFRVEGHAYDPSPADGETDVPFLNQSIMWTAGSEATSHDVYLGTDADAVAAANTNSPEFKLNQVLGDTDYALTGLMVHETYYWRIDEQSAVHPSGLKGDVWSFTVGMFLVVEDFDFYASTNGAEPRLSAVWDDYWVNGSDGWIYLEKDVNVIRELDSKAVELSFFNVAHGGSGYIGAQFDVQDMSELDIGSDWTIGGVKALFLYTRGDPCNAQVVPSDAKDNPLWGAAHPWIELEDTSSNVGYVVHPNPDQMGSDTWKEWHIDLNIFDACGVTLSAIDRFTIGIGGDDRTAQKSKMSDYGHIWVDDIRLYPPRCRTDVEGVAYFNSKGDFSGPDGTADCTVDEFDLDVMGAEWLVSDYNAQAAPPADPPEVWYRFDDSTSSTVLANSGSWDSQYDIHISSPNAADEPAWTTDVAPAIDVCDPNYARDFDGVDDYLEIPNSPTTNFAETENMTITAWIKGTTEAWDAWVCSTKGSGDRHATGIGTMGANEFGYFWNEWEWNWDSGLTIDDNQWTFTAVAVEPTKATAYVYNGTTLNKNTNVTTHGPLEEFGTDDFTVIGSNADTVDPPHCFNGTIDDVRLYNKTLTIGEIMGLAGISGEVYVPNQSVANIAPKTPPPTNPDPDDPDTVNFHDYEVLVDNWLAQFLWP